MGPAGSRIPLTLHNQSSLVLLWFFCLPRTVKRQPIKRIPVLIALGAILLIGLTRWLQIGFFESLERMTYDMRVRQALQFAPH